MSLSEMTESLKIRSQAMAFASSSTGNKPFVIKEEVGYNFKKTFKKPSEKFTGNKAMVTCVKDVEVSHRVASRVRP